MQIQKNSPTFGARVIVDQKSLRSLGKCAVKAVDEMIPKLKTLADDTVTFKVSRAYDFKHKHMQDLLFKQRKRKLCYFDSKMGVTEFPMQAVDKINIMAVQKRQNAGLLNRLIGRKFEFHTKLTDFSKDSIQAKAERLLRNLKEAQKYFT